MNKRNKYVLSIMFKGLFSVTVFCIAVFFVMFYKQSLVSGMSLTSYIASESGKTLIKILMVFLLCILEFPLIFLAMSYLKSGPPDPEKEADRSELRDVFLMILAFSDIALIIGMFISLGLIRL